MSSIAIGLRDNKAVRFWDSTNGKKAVMAVSGLILFLFVLGHMLATCRYSKGPEQFNEYGRLLRTLPEALWAVRIILLVMVILHIVSSVQLASARNKRGPSATRKEDDLYRPTPRAPCTGAGRSCWRSSSIICSTSRSAT